MRKAAMNSLVELAQQDPRVLLAVSDVSQDVIGDFQKKFPERLFIEGVSEAHLIGMAAGLAKEGAVVFVNTIASFLSRRAIDQVAINLCLENLNVRMLSQGGGLLYGQHGPTHHANEDVALMRSLPGMTVVTPFDTEHVHQVLQYSLSHQGPMYIRLAKGNTQVISCDKPFLLSEPVVFKKPGKTLLIAMGTMTQTALQIAERIPDCGVVGVHTLKPLAKNSFANLMDQANTVITIEEHSMIGGLATVMSEIIARHCQKKPKFLNFALKDEFVRGYGKQEQLLQQHGLDADSIYNQVVAHV